MLLRGARWGWRPQPLQLLSFPWPFQRRRALPLPTLGPRGPLPSAISVDGRSVLAIGDMTGVQLCMDPTGTGRKMVPVTTQLHFLILQVRAKVQIKQGLAQSHTASQGLEPRGCDP